MAMGKCLVLLNRNCRSSIFLHVFKPFNDFEATAATTLISSFCGYPSIFFCLSGPVSVRDTAAGKPTRQSSSWQGTEDLSCYRCSDTSWLQHQEKGAIEKYQGLKIQQMWKVKSKVSWGKRRIRSCNSQTGRVCAGSKHNMKVKDLRVVHSIWPHTVIPSQLIRCVFSVTSRMFPCAIALLTKSISLQGN